MDENTEFSHRYKLAKFIVRYINYDDCVSFHRRNFHGKTRLLGDLGKLVAKEKRCDGKLLPRNFPAVVGLPKWHEVNDCLYSSKGLRDMFSQISDLRALESPEVTSIKLKRKRRKNYSEPLRHHYISVLSKQFYDLLNNERFRDCTKNSENITQILKYMWRPTRPVESVGQYAVAKHASIHYILSTHAILPSSECFTPDDIQRIMHLPMEWIGALPRLEDTRCITKFIACFSELFAREPNEDSDAAKDPLNKHARQCGRRVFLDIIRYASTGLLPMKASRRLLNTTSVLTDTESTQETTVEEDEDKYPPLDWEDQLSRKNVNIIEIVAPVKNLPPKITPFRRAVQRPTLKPVHSELVSVDQMKLSREIDKITYELDRQQRKAANRKNERYRLSRAVTRASELRCGSTLDRPEEKVKPIPTDQLRKEEKEFNRIVGNLPHRQYDIEKLKKLNKLVIAGLQPDRYTATWIRDPIADRRHYKWTLTWNPNRRIYVENAIRHGCLPPLDVSKSPRLGGKPRRHNVSVFTRHSMSASSEQRFQVLSTKPIVKKKLSRASQPGESTAPKRPTRTTRGSMRFATTLSTSFD